MLLGHPVSLVTGCIERARWRSRWLLQGGPDVLGREQGVPVEPCLQRPWALALGPTMNFATGGEKGQKSPFLSFLDTAAQSPVLTQQTENF